ncbi:MAG: hypothetical protein A2008_13470 [Candidatus Wallbacteria bacterium GWC2_49_35]|uniref:FecR protein domain-containing protein n=1 Tax=Candidatus Wallbacteria bacterium GWC2_49_35 TaxID=1817813 RepID=A0A1F7WG29_9BACT|nr:MAG: hypothetical protein A2008_13470 [Candidatus Wallbacteria bacterium GWC2_49_35]HBC74178.1 hypothetical protein [Candidatus Wallbacteria bacterium]
MKSFKFYAALAIVSILLITAASYATSGEPLATITKIKGAPQIIKAATAQTVAIKMGETVEMGDTIVTDADSRATLIFNDGEIRVITSGSNVKFSEGDKHEQLTSIAKVTATLADAVNAKNLEKTFESVTGAKLSMSGGAERPKKAAEVKSVPGGTSAADDKGTSYRNKELDINMAEPQTVKEEVSASAGAPSSADVPETSGNLTSAPIPTLPPASVPSEPAGKSSASVLQDIQVSEPSSANAPAVPERLDDEGVAKARAEFKPHPKAVTRESQAAVLKQWGYWFDDENSAAWNLLIPERILKSSEKISFKSATSSQELKNTGSKVAISDHGTGPLTLVVIFTNKQGKMASLRAELKIDNAAKNKVIEEINKIEGLKADDLETYLYVKASIFKQNKFYLAALAALDQLEKLQPQVKMPHALKSKAIIYHEMGETELMKAAIEALKH